MPRTKTRPKKSDVLIAHEPGLARDVMQAKDLPPGRLSDLLSKALRVIEQKLLDDEALRLTLSEYLRLLKVERDLQPETDKPTEIA
jgi:hypothetical protein